MSICQPGQAQQTDPAGVDMKALNATGEAYNAAARALARETTEPLSEPPRLYPIVTTPCTHGCDGSPHPGYVCETWHPFDRNGRPRTGWATCQAANLPRGRAQSLTDRFREKPSYGYHPDYTWVLALTYALLLDEQPDTAPDPHRLRAAVEADDLAAVDALMMPLDFAAVRLLDVPAEEWHAQSRPRLHAWATKVTTAPEDEPPVWDMTRIEYGSRCLQLAERWLESQQERRNHYGYMEIESIQWGFSVPFLTTVLMRQVGGHPRGSEVRLRDGRRVTIRGVHWGETGGPPVAYDVREVGASPFPLDNPRVAAEEILAAP